MGYGVRVRRSFREAAGSGWLDEWAYQVRMLSISDQRAFPGSHSAEDVSHRQFWCHLAKPCQFSRKLRLQIRKVIKVESSIHQFQGRRSGGQSGWLDGGRTRFVCSCSRTSDVFVFHPAWFSPPLKECSLVLWAKRFLGRCVTSFRNHLTSQRTWRSSRLSDGETVVPRQNRLLHEARLSKAGKVKLVVSSSTAEHVSCFIRPEELECRTMSGRNNGLVARSSSQLRRSPAPGGAQLTL